MSCMIEQPIPMLPTNIGDHMINDNCASSISENFTTIENRRSNSLNTQRILGENKTMHKKNIQPKNRITFAKKRTIRRRPKNTTSSRPTSPIQPSPPVNTCRTKDSDAETFIERPRGGLKPKSNLKRKVSFNENETNNNNNNNNNKRAKKSCKNVVFASHVNIREYMFDLISMVDKGELWYNSQDLENFRTQAKTIIDHTRNYGCDGVEYRGLESRICEERLTFRHIATRTVLKCQRYLNHKRLKLEQEALHDTTSATTNTTPLIDVNTKQSTEEQTRLKYDLKLASVAGKCSRWATAIALETAQKDHFEIYGKKSATV